jgi:RecB family exonuclease
MHERLFDPGAEVEEIEHSFRFPYPHTLERPGSAPVRTVHSFEAKIDRLDRLPVGHRIVDYKTGDARNKLLAPSPDDFQLGIYAMALSHHQNGHDEGEDSLLRPAAGVAEYWVLSTGARGEIDLADIAYDKVKKAVDEAIAGMLTGPFERGERARGGCWGLCEMFLGE